MKAAKLFIMSHLAIAFALGSSASYAHENGNEGAVFLSGKIEASDRIAGCSGNCSAAPSGTIGIGYDFSYMAIGGPVRAAVSMEYSRQRFNINGNTLDVTVKALTLSPGFSFGKDDQFIMALPIQLGAMTSGGTNIPERTGFGGSYGINFLYQVEPRLYLIVGVSSLMVATSNQPDFYSSTTNVGFRWHL